MAQEAVRLLPELLARKLPQLLPDDEDREISAPIRIRLPVRMSELTGDTTAQIGGAAPAGARSSAPLDQRVESALRVALGLHAAAPAAGPPAGPAADTPAKLSDPIHQKISRESGALARLLLAWHEQKSLEHCLRALPPREIQDWHDWLWKKSAATAPPEADTALAQRIEATILVLVSSSVDQGSADILRRRILIATEAAARLSVPLTHLALWQALDQLLAIESPRSSRDPAVSIPRVGSSSQVPPLHERWNSAVAQKSTSAEVTGSADASQRQPVPWEIKVACAVPFLVLGPLAQLGYFAALDAVLEAANLSQDAPLFAAALAYKVLDPPQRGWRRSPPSEVAAAAFAGRSNTVSEESLVEFSRRMAPHTAALDVILTEALIAGHTPGGSVTLHAAGSQGADFLVIDTQGCFPISWTHGLESLVSVFRRLGTPIVLISDAGADTDLLRDLAAAGITFVTGMPPTRGERWQRVLQGSTPLGWTNSPGPVAGPLQRAARELPAALEEANGLDREMVLTRPAVIRAISAELDRTLTLAASVAMAVVSWKLWRSRGRTSPQQVLERFADLDGRIRFNEASVKVHLPLGRRHQELRDGGLLGTVENIPWFGRRRIEFGGDC
jgi:hypothetical protein